MEQLYNFHKNAPAGYAHCFRTDCTSAATCLRALAGHDLGEDVPTVCAVNPKLADPAGSGKCPFFREAKTVSVAYGFMHALSMVPSGQIASVRAAISRLGCDRMYYFLRRGEKPMFPDKQKQIADILAAHGAPIPVKFDRYEQQIDWRI